MMGMLLEVVAGGTCTGASAGLAADQCTAWGQFWDGAGGPNWTHFGQGCTKVDPCGSSCGGGRAIAKLMLVMGMLLEVVAAETCAGASAGLAPDQCAAWGQFWDGAGGPNWTDYGHGCTKIDPCGSSCNSVTCTGSSITFM